LIGGNPAPSTKDCLEKATKFQLFANFCTLFRTGNPIQFTKNLNNYPAPFSRPIQRTVARAVDAFPSRPRRWTSKITAQGPGGCPRIGLGTRLPPLRGSDGPGWSFRLTAVLQGSPNQSLFNCALFLGVTGKALLLLPKPCCLRPDVRGKCVQNAFGGDRMNGSPAMPRCTRRRARTARKRSRPALCVSLRDACVHACQRCLRPKEN